MSLLPRRSFLALTATGLAAEGLRSLARADDRLRTHGWVPAGVSAPVFPARDLPVTQFGATGDGRTDARPAFQEAIRRCARDGGGRVVVPAGTWWLEGPLHLASGVNLHLDDRARLRFRTDDPRLYLPAVLTRWEGTEVFNYSPFIYAYQAQNVAITGGGLLDGNALESFVLWRGRQGEDQKRLRALGAAGAPVHDRVFGDGHFLRPSFVQFFGCTGVLMEDFRLIDSPFWCTHTIACSNVTVRRLTVESEPVNSDGFDAESCCDVLVEDCVFRVGDDCVAIKSGRVQDGWRLARPSTDILVRRCRFRNTLPAGSGLAVGSEMSGGVRRIRAEDLEMDYAKVAINVKANLDRGGCVEHVDIRRVSVKRADTFIQITTDYHGYRGGDHPPVFRALSIQDAVCAEAGQALNAVGTPASPVQGLRLDRIQVVRASEKPRLGHLVDAAFSDVSVNGTPVQAP